MPVGKNALKRVTNNGYSKVAVSAPDMEHSEVVADPTPVKESSAKTTPNKNSAPKTKKAPVKKPAIEKVEAPRRPDGFVRYEFGDELPTYLL